MSKYAPHCSFFIAAAWPMFILALLILRQLIPEIFNEKTPYPIWSIFVIGCGNLLALLFWKHVLNRDTMEYGRFFLGAIVTATIGIIFLNHMHDFKNNQIWYKYLLAVFVTYQFVFPVIYFSELWVCQGSYVDKIVV